MQLFVCVDGDNIGQMIGRARINDDVEEVRRVSQRIDRGQEVWKAWAINKGGSVIEAGGDEIAVSVPVAALPELEGIRQQYAQLVEATVSVGVGMRLSEASKALLAAKLRGKDRVCFYTDEVEQEIAQAGLGDLDEAAKLRAEYGDVKKAEGEVPLAKDQPAMAQGDGAGFSGATRPQAPSLAKPDGPQGEHSEAQDLYDLLDEDRPTPPEATHAASDFERQLHEEAWRGEEQDMRAAHGATARAQEVRARVAQALQAMQAQAPVLEQMRQAAPEAYSAMLALAQGVTAMARELGTSAPAKDRQDLGKTELRPLFESGSVAPMRKDEDQPVAPHRDLQSDPGYVYHATNAERAHSIAHEGLGVHEPSEFTDQNMWPDGSVEPRNYHSANAGAVHVFAPEEGRPVILRTPTAKHPFQQERYTKDMYSTTPVPAEHMEILTGGGWQPLRQWAGLHGNRGMYSAQDPDVAKDEMKVEVEPDGKHPGPDVLDKAKLPMPKASAHHAVVLPPGSQMARTRPGAAGSVAGANSVKVQHSDGTTSVKQVTAGQIRSQDPSGHPVSSREPNSR